MSYYNPDNLPVIPPLPANYTRPADGAIMLCGACGMRILQVMGYVCQQPDCPVIARSPFTIKSQAAQYLQTVDKGLIVDERV